MLIYICCAGGATLSMLCIKIAKASKKKYETGYILELIPNINQYLSQNEIVFAYGPVSVIDMRAFGFMDGEKIWKDIQAILYTPGKIIYNEIK